MNLLNLLKLKKVVKDETQFPQMPYQKKSSTLQVHSRNIVLVSSKAEIVLSTYAIRDAGCIRTISSERRLCLMTICFLLKAIDISLRNNSFKLNVGMSVI